MTIHNAADFGYTTLPPVREVRAGDVFRRRVQDGVAEYEVRGRWDQPGIYRIVTLKRWVVEPTDKNLLAFVGASDTFTTAGILADLYAP